MKELNIAIPAWRTSEDSLGVTLPYLRFIAKFGNPKILLPTDNIEFNPLDYDAVIMPGGPDVNPQRYGQLPEPFTGKPCLYKEYFDLEFIPKCIKKGIPIFGICRGFQSLNVIFGGTITQHINTNYHGLNDQYDRSEEVHEVKALEDNIPTEELLKAVPKETNSIHHQAIFKEELSEDLIPLIVHYPYEEIVEAFIHKLFPIAAVQWHPEELDDLFSQRLFKFIINQKERQNEGNNTENAARIISK